MAAEDVGLTGPDWERSTCWLWSLWEEPKGFGGAAPRANNPLPWLLMNAADIWDPCLAPDLPLSEAGPSPPWHREHLSAGTLRAPSPHPVGLCAKSEMPAQARSTRHG